MIKKKIKRVIVYSLKELTRFYDLNNLYSIGAKHTGKEAVIMQLIEWEVNEDGYEEQRDLAAREGISTDEKQKVTVRKLNLTTGGSYTGRLAITGNHQVYLPTEIRKMLEGAGRIRIQLV